MDPLAYVAAPDLGGAHALVARDPAARFIAGGTDMLQLLGDRVLAPPTLVDLNPLPLSGVRFEPDTVAIGALTRLRAVECDPALATGFPALTEALAATASVQVRNMATVGGNLLQRTRCLYFRDVATPCNKRAPGSGCPAQDGRNRHNAILGGSRDCIAVHPSDLAVALVALDAEIEIAGRAQPLRVPADYFHLLPEDRPDIETVLGAGEVIAAVHLPRTARSARSHYLKVRDRASFAFALASAAVAIETGDDGAVTSARVAVGGVATKPWRLRAVEAELTGRMPTTETIHRAAAFAAEDAEPRGDNAYKRPLLVATVARALEELMERQP